MHYSTVSFRAIEVTFSSRHYRNRLSFRLVALSFRIDVSVRRGKPTL